MRRACALTVLLVTAALASAAPPDVPAKITAKPGQLVRITVKTDAEIGSARNFTDSEGFWGELVGPKGERQFVFQPPVDGKKTEYVVSFWTKGEVVGVTTTITVESAAPAPPPGPAPGPTPGPTPPPGPVTSFRLIFIYESGDKLTPTQNSVMYGKDVEAYLTAKTTRDGNLVGWRRRDKNDAVTGDTTVMNALWSDVKPKVTATPSVAVEVNGKVEIVPLPATQTEMIAMLKKYIGDK